MKKSSTPTKPDQRSWIRYSDTPTQGGVYFAGGMLWDERLFEGRLRTRYWASHGQILPEGHIANVPKDQPFDTFQLGINGQNLSGGYVWESAELTPDESGYRTKDMAVTHGVVSLKHAEAGIRVKVHTRVDRSRYLTRWLEVENLGDKPAAITDLAPLGGILWHHSSGTEHLAPPQLSPFELAETGDGIFLKEGDFWFKTLPQGTHSYNGGKHGKSGWGRPMFWVKNLCNGQTFVCEFAWGGNWEFTFDCRLSEDHEKNRHAALSFRMAMSGYDPALRVLDPGETVKTPPVHIALFEHDVEAIVQATHDYVRHAILPEPVPGRYIEIEANHRGYLCDRETVPDIIKDVDVAKSVGTELYVIDAGWYGPKPNVWYLNVGDWSAGEWLEGGLEPIVKHVKNRGMKFGLWVEIEAAGDRTTLFKEHQDWLFSRDGRPVNSRCLDFSNPVVVDWAENQIETLIKRYQLDMYRIDNNHMLSPSGNRQYGGFTEDLIWRYYDNFFGMFERLRKKFPKVVFQNCSSGGGRLDWGTMHRFHNVEVSDWLRSPRAVKANNGLSMSLPPEILLRTFGTESWQQVLDGDLDAQLRLVCMCRPIFRGIAPSLDLITPELRDRIEHHLDIYRKVIRPLLPECKMYHHTPFLPLFEHRGFCAMEYATADKKTAVAAIFRLSTVVGDEYLFKPRGVDASRNYDVTFDNSNETVRISGLALKQTGLVIRLERTMSSELLILKAVKARG